MNNKTYDRLKWIAMYFLPAIGTLYFALAGIWGFPYGEEVIGTTSALTIFLSIILGISSTQYHGDGKIRIDASNPGKNIYRIDFDGSPDELSEKDTVTLEVDAETHIDFVEGV